MSTAIILLKYLEPEFQQTVECCEATGLPIFYADRDGVGNMSRAFNEAFIKHVQHRFMNVWFVTNITFEKEVPQKLAEALHWRFGAVHPAMDNSDHLHLRSNGSQEVTAVPFIEFTAPMFTASVFSKYMLDENLWYYYYDLEICHRMKETNHQVAVHNGASISHTYLRNNKIQHPVSKIRTELRKYMTAPNRQYLNQKYGPEWPQLFNWKS